MLSPDQVAASLERCIDETGAQLAALPHYTNGTMAYALRTHLAAILEVMLESADCTREEAREFLRDLEREVLQEGESPETED